MYVPKYLKLQTISLGFPPNITGSISNVFRLSSEITELFKVNNASSVPLAFFYVNCNASRTSLTEFK